jgi:DNA-binding LytR/AlgR family response regulator
MKPRVLIVEDEAIIADDLNLILEDGGFEVLGPVDNAQDAFNILDKSSLELVLLDINIKGDIDGIEIGKKIKTKYKIPFIFITSYFDEETQKKVMSVEPSGYIIKPFQEEEVLINAKLALKKKSLQQTKLKTDKIFVRDTGVLKPLKYQEVLYAKGEDNYTRICTKSGKEYIISSTLKVIESKLPVQLFVRIHKSFIINIDFIETIEGNSLEINQKSIPIGKAYRSDLFNVLDVL